MTNVKMKTEKDSFTLQIDGSIDVVAKGKVYYLPPADLRRYRKVKGLLMAASRDMASQLGVTTGDLQSGKVDDIDPGTLMKAEEGFEDAMIGIVRQVFEGAGCPLPEDDNEWSAWLTNTDLPNKILAHWKMTPLDRGR